MQAQDAKNIAERAHAGQVDKQGEPYIGHPARVAGRLIDNKQPEWLVAVAWLHDVLEDTDIRLPSLRRMGLTERQEEVLLAVTRTDTETYTEYIIRLSGDRDAVSLKLSDLADNMREDRQFEGSESLMQRYKEARWFLMGTTT